MNSDFLLGYAFCVLLLGESTRAELGTECPSSLWIQFRNGCYTFLPATLKNSFGIDNARELCKVSGADIISINDEEENKFITKTFKKEWQGPKEVFLGIFFDTDDNTFKWFDNSKVTFTNWIKEDISEEVLNTCAALHTQSGQWRKMSCENFTEMGTLCKATLVSHRKKTVADQRVLILTLAIVFVILVAIVSVVLWVLYKRDVFPSRLSTNYRSADTVPYTDESVLVDAEEKECSA